MKNFVLLNVWICATACSSDPAPRLGMVEVFGPGSAFQRMETGAAVIQALADEGLPDMSCTGEAELEPRCENAVTPYELLVSVVHNEDMSNIYVQCRVSHDSDHPDLMDICLRRVREELAR